MIGLGEGQEPEKQVIVDMRGPTTRFVLDPALLGLSDSSEKATAAPLLGQELLYNLNLLVDMEQVEFPLNSFSFPYSLKLIDFSANYLPLILELPLSRVISKSYPNNSHVARKVLRLLTQYQKLSIK